MPRLLNDPTLDGSASTVNMMSADIVASRTLASRGGRGAYNQFVRRYRAAANEFARAHGGALLGSDGDAVYCAFPTPAGARQAATQLLGWAAAPEQAVQLRIGIVSAPGSFQDLAHSARNLVEMGVRLLAGRFIPVQTWSDDRIARLHSTLGPLAAAVQLSRLASPGEIRLSPEAGLVLGNPGGSPPPMAVRPEDAER